MIQLLQHTKDHQKFSYELTLRRLTHHVSKNKSQIDNLLFKGQREGEGEIIEEEEDNCSSSSCLSPKIIVQKCCSSLCPPLQTGTAIYTSAPFSSLLLLCLLNCIIIQKYLSNKEIVCNIQIYLITDFNLPFFLIKI